MVTWDYEVIIVEVPCYEPFEIWEKRGFPPPPPKKQKSEQRPLQFLGWLSFF